jgi:hypothetical protein
VALKDFMDSNDVGPDYPPLKKASELAVLIAKGVRQRGCSPKTAALMWLSQILKGAPPWGGGAGH